MPCSSNNHRFLFTVLACVILSYSYTVYGINEYTQTPLIRIPQIQAHPSTRHLCTLVGGAVENFFFAISANACSSTHELKKGVSQCVAAEKFEVLKSIVVHIWKEHKKIEECVAVSESLMYARKLRDV